MITEENLNKLADFGKEQDGSYSDRWQFKIVPVNHRRTIWDLYLCGENGNEMTLVKRLYSMEDLEEFYYILSDPKQELEYKN